jgi:hypothetical protein
MSQLEAMLAFPTHVYTVEKPEYIESVRKVALEALNQIEISNEIYPVKMTGGLEHDTRIQDFAAFTAITAGNILTDQGYQTVGMGAYFESMWCQEHHKHSGMDQHTHPGVLMVGFYFLDVPEDSSAITFFDPRPGKVATGPVEANPADITYASLAFHMAAKPGLLVFTNSWLPHAFTRHGGTEPLRFVHFNIGLTEHKHQCDVEVI